MTSNRAAAGRLKVMRIIARLNIGGPARHIAALQEGLSSEEVESILVYGTPDAAEGALEAATVAGADKAVKLARLGRRVQIWDDAIVLGQLFRLMRRERPDVIETHTAKAGTLGRLAAAAYNATRAANRRAAVIHTFHGHVMTGYFGPIVSRAIRALETGLARTCDYIVVLSSGQRLEIVERLQIAPRDRVVVVPLGLDLKHLLAATPLLQARQELGLPANAVVVGYVGRLVRIKDLETLLRAIAVAAREVPELALLIVGDGELRGHLEETARSLGLASIARFAGWRLDLPAVYAAIDIVALSSLNEGTPVTIIEGMAAALPVVATNVGGVPDLVEHDVTGLLAPPRDPSALAHHIIRLAKSAALRREFGARGRQRVTDAFAPARLATDMTALYLSAVRSRRSG